MLARSACALLIGIAVFFGSLVGPASAQAGDPDCHADAAWSEGGRPAPGPLTVTYFGTSTLLFSDGRDRILIDGFFSRPGLGALLTSALVPDEAAIRQGLGESQLPLRAVLAAHGHHDHAMDVPQILRDRPEAVVVGTPAVHRLVQSQGTAPNRLCQGSEREPLSFGAFRVWAYDVEHGPSPAPLRWLLDRPPERDISGPAWFGAYKDDQNLSFLIEHQGRRILVHPSAGVRDLAGLNAEVVFLGLAGVGKMSEPDATAYFEAVLGPRTVRIIPIHWDRFTTPLGEPLQAIPWPLDDISRGFSLLCGHPVGNGERVLIRMDAGTTMAVWDSQTSAGRVCDPADRSRSFTR